MALVVGVHGAFHAGRTGIIACVATAPTTRCRTSLPRTTGHDVAVALAAGDT